MPTKKTFCSICSAFCGFEAEVENNTILSARVGLWDNAHEMSMWFNATSPESGYTQAMNADMDGMNNME